MVSSPCFTNPSYMNIYLKYPKANHCLIVGDEHGPIPPRKLLVNHSYQVIQFVTFSSLIVGGHQQPLKRVTNHHPKKVTSRITRINFKFFGFLAIFRVRKHLAPLGLALQIPKKTYRDFNPPIFPVSNDLIHHPTDNPTVLWFVDVWKNQVYIYIYIFYMGVVPLFHLFLFRTWHTSW